MIEQRRSNTALLDSDTTTSTAATGIVGAGVSDAAWSKGNYTCRSGATGFFADPSSCSIYHWCVLGVLQSTHRCNAGLHFSASANACLWPKDADCKMTKAIFPCHAFSFSLQVKDKSPHHIHPSNVHSVVQVTFLIRTIVRYFIIVMVSIKADFRLSIDRTLDLGNKPQSDSLLCSSGLVWNSRKICFSRSFMMFLFTVTHLLRRNGKLFLAS